MDVCLYSLILLRRLYNFFFFCCWFFIVINVLLFKLSNTSIFHCEEKQKDSWMLAWKSLNCLRAAKVDENLISIEMPWPGAFESLKKPSEFPALTLTLTRTDLFAYYRPERSQFSSLFQANCQYWGQRQTESSIIVFLLWMNRRVLPLTEAFFRSLEF